MRVHSRPWAPLLVAMAACSACTGALQQMRWDEADVRVQEPSFRVGQAAALPGPLAGDPAEHFLVLLHGGVVLSLSNSWGALMVAAPPDDRDGTLWVFQFPARAWTRIDTVQVRCTRV